MYENSSDKKFCLKAIALPWLGNMVCIPGQASGTRHLAKTKLGKVTNRKISSSIIVGIGIP